MKTLNGDLRPVISLREGSGGVKLTDARVTWEQGKALKMERLSLPSGPTREKAQTNERSGTHRDKKFIKTDEPSSNAEKGGPGQMMKRPGQNHAPVENYQRI